MIRWVADKACASRIERRCKQLLRQAGKNREDGWFDVPSEWAAKAINVAADRERVPLYSNDSLRRFARALSRE